MLYLVELLVEPVIILGRFVPEKLHVREIKVGLHSVCRKHGIVLGWHGQEGLGDLDIRDPLTNKEIRAPSAINRVNDWHFDAARQYPAAIILWCNILPTELQGYEGIVEPYDVALVDNDRVLHRVPRIPEGETYPDRWFARAILPKNTLITERKGGN